MPGNSQLLILATIEAALVEQPSQHVKVTLITGGGVVHTISNRVTVQVLPLPIPSVFAAFMSGGSGGAFERLLQLSSLQ